MMTVTHITWNLSVVSEEKYLRSASQYSSHLKSLIMKALFHLWIYKSILIEH